tara:strand:- start:64 stop:345 length:282 start_codon:yes stop_codon:yes gene_type:complete
MELAQDVGQHRKNFLQTLYVARGLQVPGYVVLYTVAENPQNDGELISAFRMMKIYPEISKFHDVTVNQYLNWLRDIHANCKCKDNGQDSTEAS